MQLFLGQRLAPKKNSSSARQDNKMLFVWCKNSQNAKNSNFSIFKLTALTTCCGRNWAAI
jgi:hypothetical protein